MLDSMPGHRLSTKLPRGLLLTPTGGPYAPRGDRAAAGLAISARILRQNNAAVGMPSWVRTVDATRLARQLKPSLLATVRRPLYLSQCGPNRALVSLTDRADSPGATYCPLCPDLFGEHLGGTSAPAGCRELRSQ